MSLRRPLWAAVLSLAPGTALAGGFEFPDNGVRALGRGGAFVARADDPSAIYHNPSGVTRLLRPTLLTDLNVSHIAYGFERAVTERTTRDGEVLRVPAAGGFDRVENSAPPFPAPFLAYVHPLGDFAVGGGIYGPSAYGWRRFPADGPQRYALIEGAVVLTYSTLTLAWQGWDGRLRLGASVQAASVPKMRIVQKTDGDPGVLTSPLQKDFVQKEDARWDNTSTLDLFQRLIPTGILGVTVAPAPWLEAGASWRPGYRLQTVGTLAVDYSKHFLYDADLDDPAVHNREREADCLGRPPEERFRCSRDPVLSGDGAALTFSFPHAVRGGVRYIGRDTPAGPERFDIELDVVWEGWSSVDRMVVELEGDLTYHPFIGTSFLQKVPLRERPIVLPHDWLDTLTVRLGGDWRLDERLTLRAGATAETSTFRPRAVDLLADGFPRATLSLGATYAPTDAFALSAGGSVSLSRTFRSTGGGVTAQVPMSDCLPPYDDEGACAFDGEPTGNPVGAGDYDSRIVVLGLGLTTAF